MNLDQDLGVSPEQAKVSRMQRQSVSRRKLHALLIG